MKALGVVAVWLMACNAPVGEMGAEAGAEVAALETDAGPRRPRVKPPKPPRVARDAGTVDSGPPEKPEPPCYYVSLEVETTWPSAHRMLKRAASRWYRRYEPGGVQCELRVLSSAERNIGSAGSRGDIVLNTDSDLIVGGRNCDGDHVLLIDVLTHELGHVYGLPHDTERRGCGTCEVGFCDPVVPTRREIRAANGCGDWGPPAGAECPL